MQRNFTSGDIVEIVLDYCGGSEVRKLAEIASWGCAINVLDLHISGVAWDLRDEHVRHLVATIRGGALPNLRSIDIEESDLDDEGVKAIAGAARQGCLQKLETLDFTNTAIGNEGLVVLAQAWRQGALPRLRQLLVTGTKVSLVDEALLRSRDATLIFKAALDGVQLKLIRFAFVGMGGVGKSSLFRRIFLDELACPPPSTTLDIDLIRGEELKWKPKIGQGDSPSKDVLIPHVWDFGGQWMLHGVHEDYLTPDGRTIYILALAADRAPQRDRKRDCLDDGNGLDYWLRTISRFAGPSAPVIVAITKCDPYAPGVRRRIDEPLDATDNRPVCQWSPTELSERTDSAVSSIVDGCSATSAMNSVEPIRTAIEAALDNLAALREKRVPRELMPLIHRVTDEWGSRSGVTVDEFRDWCRAADIESPELQDACLRILSDLGILFFYGRTAQEQRQMRESEDRRKLWLQTLPEGQRRRVLREREPVLDEFVLNPDWIKWPLYRVTRESERASKRGFITRAEIEDAICQGNAELQRSRNTFCVPERGAEIVFAVLRQTELCLWVESEGEYLFPRGLPADGLNLIPEWAKKGGQGYDAAKHGSIRWGFFSKSSFQRLIVRNYHLASERRCWRYGIVIRSGHCEAVVVAEPDDNRVDIHLHGGSNAEQRRIYQSLKSFAEVYIGDPMEEQAPHWNESSAKAEIHASSADYRESVSSESIESGFAAANAVRKCKLRVDLEKRLIYVGIKAYPQSSALACEIVQRLIDADGGIVPADKLLEDIGKTATADRCKEALAKLSPEVRRLIGGRAGQGGGRFLMPKAFGG